MEKRKDIRSFESVLLCHRQKYTYKYTYKYTNKFFGFSLYLLKQSLWCRGQLLIVSIVQLQELLVITICA